MSEQFGATPAQWEHFSKTLGLTADLLPVVSKPTAKISAQSTMKQLGKTPSRYNGSGEVVGIANWTQHQSTETDIRSWSSKPDYGIALQTRTVRAFDIDCEDSGTVLGIMDMLQSMIGRTLPMRYRDNSAKCLLAFALPGDLPKRVIRMKEGIIELLGSGQQFIACGTHPSGAKYLWADNPLLPGLPEAMPELTLKQVDDIWSALEAAFAVAPSTSVAAPSKTKVLHAAIKNDPIAQHLVEIGSVLSTDRDGKMHITCPFVDGHSGDSAVSSTTYFPRNTGGYVNGHFHCLHASCGHRVDQDFRDALEVPYDDPVSDFEDLTLTPDSLVGTPPAGTEAPEIKIAKLEKDKKPRFTVVPAHEFAQAKPQQWIIKGVLPRAEVGVVFGESTAGKSFWILDLAGAVALGREWRGHRVKQGKVVCVVAEGAGGMRGRLTAYGNEAGVALCDLPIGIIADAPNFLEVSDVKGVLEAIRPFAAHGELSLVVVDTFAQVMAGANENSGEDVGRALKHCKALSKATGALVLLVHHAGKDTSKGARGWSGLRAAADVEIEIARDGNDRVATLTKMKDGMDGAHYGFELAVVEVDRDDDGDPVTSCYIKHTDYTKKVSGKSPTDLDALVKQSVCDAIGLGAEHSVSYDRLVGLVTGGMQQSKASPGTAGTAIHRLIDAGVLTIKGDQISLSPIDSDLV